MISINPQALVTQIQVVELAATPRGEVFGWTTDRNQGFAILKSFAAAGLASDPANFHSGWLPGNDDGECERIVNEWNPASRASVHQVLAC